MKNDFELIVTIVNKGFSDYVIDASRDAGATGGTIINARGTGNDENESFMGINIQPEKEMVLTLVKTESKKQIMQEICERTNLNDDGRGLCFSLPITSVAGISSFKEIKDEKTTKPEKQAKIIDAK